MNNSFKIYDYRHFVRPIAREGEGSLCPGWWLQVKGLYVIM